MLHTVCRGFDSSAWTNCCPICAALLMLTLSRDYSSFIGRLYYTNWQRLYCSLVYKQISDVMSCMQIAGPAYSHRHSVDVTICPLQGNDGSVDVAVGGAQNLCVIDGDSSLQASGNTTPLAFDYETRFCILLCHEVVQWLSGTALDVRSLGRGFDSHREQLQCITTLSKLFTPMCLCHQAV